MKQTVDQNLNFFPHQICTEKFVDTLAGKSKLHVHFTGYDIPDVLVSDNGPQFSFDDFAEFSKMWEFQQVTSSPIYTQSIGKLDNRGTWRKD